jgi:6-phosphogluconolactonase (cycloisomerase 2 family)
MRLRVVLAVVLAVAVALTANSAQATTHVYMSAWNVTRIDEFRASANGALTQFGNRPENGTNPWYMVMTSNARNLYVDTYASGKLEAFNVTPTGALTPKTAAQGSSLPTGTRPYALAASPDNRNIYVPNYGAGSVSIYDLAANGSAKVHSPTTVPAGAGPSGVAVSRDGKSVYAAAQDGNIYQFDRSASGGLTAKSPAFVKAKDNGSSPTPDYLVLTPDGRHLYSANYNDSSIGVFDVHADGTLTEKQTGSPVPGGYGFYEIAMSPNGKSLYGASNSDGMVYQYSVFPDGSLHPKSPATVAAGGALDSIWLSANGHNAYVANAGTYSGGGSYTNYNLRQFSIDTAGRLHAKTPPSVPTDNYPAAVIVAPDQSPRAAFKFSTAGVHKKQFDATGAEDPDGRVTRYIWRFGDGTAPLVDGAKPTHKYAHAGTYTVTLTVVDNAGCSVAKIWTGQTAYCSGNHAATVHHSVSVK